MLDFTSVLYLGMCHASRSLRPWSQFTTGVPTVLAAPAGTRTVVQKLARLLGCEWAVLAPSTLHLFWDLFGILAKHPVAIYIDSGIYPIARWGIERAAAAGVPVRNFPHHDVAALQQRLYQNGAQQRIPLVVTDGFCLECGQPAPIGAYLKLVRQFGGYLILDDTQALGILGHSPESNMPYGTGGGGSLRWNQVAGPEILIIASLAKGFGVPVAVLAGSNGMIRSFEAKSDTRVHCSPPSIAILRAAEHALHENTENGDALREHLATLVLRFKEAMAKSGFAFAGGLFPVQTLVPVPGLDAVSLHGRLLQRGIRTVLHRRRNGAQARLSFIITARHSPTDIDRAVAVLLSQAGRKNLYPFNI